MSLWKQWMKNKSIREGISDESGAADKFRFNSDENDFGDDYEKTQTELFSAVFSKYPEETMSFLSNIGNRGDEEISKLLSKLNKEKSPSSGREPRHPMDQHEFVPSSADVGQADTSGDE